MSHTKVPWIAGPPATGMDPAVHRYIHAGGEIVARVDAGYLPNRRLAGDLEDNARLIAAAPELLEALRNLCAVPRADGWPATVAAKKVIAKATGGAE